MKYKYIYTQYAQLFICLIRRAIYPDSVYSTPDAQNIRHHPNNIHLYVYIEQILFFLNINELNDVELTN